MTKKEIKQEILENFSPRGYLRTRKLMDFHLDQSLTDEADRIWPIELLREVIDDTMIEA